MIQFTYISLCLLAALSPAHGAGSNEQGTADSSVLMQMNVARHTRGFEEQGLSFGFDDDAAEDEDMAGSCQELKFTILAKSRPRLSTGPPPNSETSFDLISSGRSLRFVFMPNSTLARVDGKFASQDIGWVPAINVDHVLTVTLRSNKIHTFTITDGDDASLTWSKDFYHTGWFPADTRALRLVRVLTSRWRKALRKGSHFNTTRCYFSDKEEHCFKLVEETSTSTPTCYRSPNICHPDVPFSHCSSMGDPHYTPYKGRSSRFNWQGNGTYNFVTSPEHSLKTQVFNCPIPRNGKPTVSVAAGVAVRIKNVTIIKIGTETKIDGVPYSSGMYTLADGVEVDISEWYLVVKGPTTNRGFGEIRASTRRVTRSPTGYVLNVFAEIPTSAVETSSGMCQCDGKQDCLATAKTSFVSSSSNLFAAFGPADFEDLDMTCCPVDGCQAPAGFEPEPTAEDLCSECPVQSGFDITTAQLECASLNDDPVQYEACQLDYCACCQEPNPAECAAMSFEGSSEDEGGEAIWLDNHTCFDPTTTLPPLDPKAEADPHCRNLRGENFDVLVTGIVPMVKVPRTVDPGSRLQIDALIAPIGEHPCAPTVIKAIHVSGSLLQGLPELNLEPTDRRAPDIPDEWLRWMDRPGAAKGNLSLNMLRSKRHTMLNLKVGGMEVDVKQRSGTKSHVKYLDIRVRNLQTFGDEAGGVLGLDDHVEEAKSPNGCDPHARPPIRLGRTVEEQEEENEVYWQQGTGESRLMSVAFSA